MGFVYKRYLGRLRLLRSSDVEENPGSRVSRRSCCIVFGNIPSRHKNLSDLSFIVRGGDLLFLPGATFPSLRFQVLKDRCNCSGERLIGFKGWLYTCVTAFRRIDSAVMSEEVAKSKLSGFIVAVMIFMSSAYSGIQIYRKIFDFIDCYS